MLPDTKNRSFVIEINPVGKYAPEAAIHSGAAMLMKWLRGNILQNEALGWDDFYNLATMAPPGSLGLSVIPYFQGVEAPYWDARSRGIIYGLGIDHKIEHVIRGIIEGLAYETRLLIKLMEDAIGRPIETIKMYGGSAQSKVWNQIFADITGCTVMVPENIQTTAIGAAICAAAGTGWYPDISGAAQNMVATSKSYRPNVTTQSLYDDLFAEIYEPFYGRVSDLMHRLSEKTGYP
jgi:xylulokinase